MSRKDILPTQTILTLLFLVSLNIAQSADKSFPEVNGPYLGQKPPGLAAHSFTPLLEKIGRMTDDIT